VIVPVAALVSIVFALPALGQDEEPAGGGYAEPAEGLMEVHPTGLATDTMSGRIWFIDEQSTPHAVGFFGVDGRVNRFAVPCDQCNGNGDKLAYIESIAVGPDSNAWIAGTYVNGDGSPLNGGLNSFVGRFTPAGQFTSFPLLTVDAFRRFEFASTGHSSITAGPDGNMWFTENSPAKIGKITMAGAISEFPLPSKFSAPSAITRGPDNNLWFTEPPAGKIGRITPSGTLIEYPTPVFAANKILRALRNHSASELDLVHRPFGRGRKRHDGRRRDPIRARGKRKSG
jgi:virginiamycin B lyase